MPFSLYLDNLLLNQEFGGASSTPPSTLYFGLSTTTPTQGNPVTGISEPSGNGYARVAVANNITDWPTTSNGQKSVGVAINYPQATGPWGTVTYFVIYDAATGGNVLAYGALTTAQPIVNGGALSFGANQLTITLN